MILDSLIKDSLVEKVENILEEVEHEVQFQNVSGNKWNIVVSFDLDKANLNEVEKLLLSGILKHL